MPRITFITPSDQRVVVEDAQGSLMTTAVDNGVEGIDGDCGGVCCCATCHVQVDPAWSDRVGPVTDDEREVLDFEERASETSRLACQIPVNETLDGLVVRVVGR